MSIEIDHELNDELEVEYDFFKMHGGVRGKYAKQYHEGVKLIMLEPDVAKIFPDAKSVNEALRTLALYEAIVEELIDRDLVELVRSRLADEDHAIEVDIDSI